MGHTPIHLVIALYAVVACCIITLGLITFFRIKHGMDHNTNTTSKNNSDRYGTNHIPFSVLNQTRFPTNVFFDNYCIYEDYLELFNEYVKITSHANSLITSVSRSLTIIESEIDSGYSDKEVLSDKLNRIESDLTEFLKNADRFYKDLTEVHTLSEHSLNKVNLHSTRIQTYVKEANMLADFADDFLLMSFRLAAKLNTKYPDTSEVFSNISQKIILIYYLGVFAITNILNEKLFGFNNPKEPN